MFVLYIVRNSKKNAIILQRRLKEKKKQENYSSGICSFSREDQNNDFLFWITIKELRKRYIDEKLEQIPRLSNRPMNFIEFENARTNKTLSFTILRERF